MLSVLLVYTALYSYRWDEDAHGPDGTQLAAAAADSSHDIIIQTT